MTGEFLAKRGGGALGLAALAMAMNLAMAAKAASASTVDIIGGPGLDQGALCVTGTLCPGTSPAFTLNSPAIVSGSFDYNPLTNMADFTLTLLSNASFGSETLLKGSVFSAASVPVTLVSLGGGATEITQSGAATGFASANFSPGLATILNAPSISGLTCSFGTGSDQCGVSLGAAGLEVGPDSKNLDYNAFLTFNVNVTPVPLPAAVWLMLSGLGYLAVFRRKRAI
jgi:hypothetical protein